MMESSSKLIHNARFMQPLLSDFLYSFSLPMAFVKLLEKELKVKSMESMPSVVLTTDDEPGCHWFVKLEGGRRFKDGWKEFCHHHGLKVGDLLVFSHQLNLIFQVSVFDPVTYCQRYFIASKTKSTCVSKLNCNDQMSGRRRSSDARIHDNSSVEGRQLSCRITLTSFAFTSTIVYLPKKFVRSSGLEYRCCDMKLINGEGKAWKVQLNHRKYDGQAYIRGGWKQFQAANSFRPQDSICFWLLECERWPIMKCYRLSSGSKSCFAKDDVLGHMTYFGSGYGSCLLLLPTIQLVLWCIKN